MQEDGSHKIKAHSNHLALFIARSSNTDSIRSPWLRPLAYGFVFYRPLRAEEWMDWTGSCAVHILSVLNRVGEITR
jgi:hypothetical protein